MTGLNVMKSYQQLFLFAAAALTAGCAYVSPPSASTADAAVEREAPADSVAGAPETGGHSVEASPMVEASYQQDPRPTSKPIEKIAPQSGATSKQGPARAVPAKKGAELMAVTELAIMNDPIWDREFARSYLSHTELEPLYSEREFAAVQRATEFVRQEKFGRARELLERYVGENASALVYMYYGNVLRQQGEIDEAIAAYEAAVTKRENFLRAWVQLASCYNEQSRHRDAITAASRVLELGAGTETVYALIGLNSLRLRQPVSAESAFRMAAMRNPLNDQYKAGIAESFMQQGRFQEAVTLFDQLIEADPDDPRLWRAQAIAYASLGKSLEAAESFEVLDALGGATVQSLGNLGAIYANEGLYGLAVSTYRRAMARDPKGDLTPMLNAARFMTASQAYDEAKELIGAIEEIRSGSIAVEDRKKLKQVLARVAVAEGDADAEAKILEDLLQIDPMDGDALILLGDYERRNGDAEKAAFNYERAAAIEGFEARAKLSHAQMLVRKREFVKARQLLKDVVRLDPRDAVTSYLRDVERAARSAAR